ncbi:MAG: imidazole glycerol phosphate synthase subunit HisH [Ruminococcaceae bacterium]|nr:imidazole glycerol phosphate synthase subunit HisH [Oscillospiraceae bacterium]
MIAIVDYGVGNLFSLKSSFLSVGADVKICKTADELLAADKIILPGVGAFRDAAKKLAASGLKEVIINEAKNGKPLLGICLGMQLLFEKSFEYGEHEGLGLIKGEIVPLLGEIKSDLKIPHMGWNALNFTENETPIFKNIKNGDHVYFVHSFYAKTAARNITATAEYDINVTASVQCGNVFGCQFHPEKSGDTGLNILKAFCDLED